MKAKYILIIPLIIIAIVFFIFMVLEITTPPYPIGGGKSVDSPDKKYVARGATMRNATQRWYKFEIREKETDKTIIKKILYPTRVYNFRGEDGLIIWSSDSKSVNFAGKSEDNSICILYIK